MTNFISRWMGWERDEPNLSPEGTRLNYCVKIRCAVRDYIKYKSQSEDYMNQIIKAKTTQPIACDEYYNHILLNQGLWTLYETASDGFSVAVTILEILIQREETVEVRMDNKVYHVSHKLLSPFGYSIEVKEIVDLTKCTCGETLLDITDPEILGRKGQVWYVCPTILHGGGKEGHTSRYEET